jgi:NADP-dependent 3-hydroxy acid dehydrogenase YdfG
MASRKLVFIGDCGHGVGTPLLSAFLSSNHRVVGFSPSRDALLSLRERFWPAFDAISVLDLLRVDLGDDAAVRECAEAAIFTHGVPDILVTHSGAMPSRYAHYYAT